MFVLDDVSRIRNEAEARWRGSRGKAAGVGNYVPLFVEVTYSGVQVKGEWVGRWGGSWRKWKESEIGFVGPSSRFPPEKGKEGRKEERRREGFYICSRPTVSCACLWAGPITSLRLPVGRPNGALKVTLHSNLYVKILIFIEFVYTITSMFLFLLILLIDSTPFKVYKVQYDTVL